MSSTFFALAYPLHHQLCHQMLEWTSTKPTLVVNQDALTTLGFNLDPRPALVPLRASV